MAITTPQDKASCKRLLGSGQDLGVKFSYIVQKKPNGLAEAYILGEKFIGSGGIAHVLGDNTSQGQGCIPMLLAAKARGVARLFLTLRPKILGDSVRLRLMKTCSLSLLKKSLLNSSSILRLQDSILRQSRYRYS